MNSIVTKRFIECHNKLKAEKRIRSSRQFALSLDYLPQSLSEILKGRRDATIELIRKAIEKYQFNPVYLFQGKGPLFMTEAESPDLRILTVVSAGKDDEKIIHVPVPAQAGYVGSHGDPGFIRDLPSFSLPDYKYKHGTHRSFDVAGDSMEPTLYEGDKVVCSFVEPAFWETSLKDNYVYVVVTRSDVLVKRVINKIRPLGQVQLVPDNEYYETCLIDLQDVKEVWYVRAKISPFLSAPISPQMQMQEDVRQLQKKIQTQTEQIQDLTETLKQFLTNQ
jgi:phage repressor protein C with HTH and peptisase S24 domain